jgi:hypothetical protein
MDGLKKRVPAKGRTTVARLGVTISLLPLSKLDVIDTDSVPEDSEFIRFQPSRNEKRQLSFNSGC